MQLKKFLISFIIFLSFFIVPINTNAQEISSNNTNQFIVSNNTIEKQHSIYYKIIDNLTEEDKILICKITFREAGNQSKEGQRAVMEVILNRTVHEDFPNTIKGVLSQPGQFSTWKSRDKVTTEQLDEMFIILKSVQLEKPILDNNYLYFNKTKFSNCKQHIKIKDHWFGAI